VPTQPPSQWVPETLSLRVVQPGREADHSPPSSAEVKEWVVLYLHSPNTPSWRRAQLKHRDTFLSLFPFRTLVLFLWSLKVRGHVSLPYKTAGKIINLCAQSISVVKGVWEYKESRTDKMPFQNVFLLPISPWTLFLFIMVRRWILKLWIHVLFVIILKICYVKRCYREPFSCVCWFSFRLSHQRFMTVSL
jgi:hypothetical protein